MIEEKVLGDRKKKAISFFFEPNKKNMVISFFENAMAWLQGPGIRVGTGFCISLGWITVLGMVLTFFVSLLKFLI